jgi:hypothetical protein
VLGLLSYFTTPIGLISLALLVGCVVHMIRTGNVFPWIYVVVFLPSVGPLIYFFMVIVPSLSRSRAARSFRTGAAKAIDPHKGFRAAQRDVEMVGSVDSKRALANQLIQRGQYTQAIETYRDALQGQFKDDPALLMGLARAQFLNGDGAGAQATLDTLQKADPSFVSQDAHLIYARALELQGKDEDAAQEYARLVPYFSGEEARARYGQLLDRLGHPNEARALYEQILKNMDGAPRRYQSAQSEWLAIARGGLR